MTEHENKTFLLDLELPKPGNRPSRNRRMAHHLRSARIEQGGVSQIVLGAFWKWLRRHLRMFIFSTIVGSILFFFGQTIWDFVIATILNRITGSAGTEISNWLKNTIDS